MIFQRLKEVKNSYIFAGLLKCTKKRYLKIKILIYKTRNIYGQLQTKAQENQVKMLVEMVLYQTEKNTNQNEDHHRMKT